MHTEFTVTPIACVIHPPGEPIFHERATRIEIEDESAGPFVVVINNNGKIALDADEWPLIREHIDRAFHTCQVLDTSEVEGSEIQQ